MAGSDLGLSFANHPPPQQNRDQLPVNCRCQVSRLSKQSRKLSGVFEPLPTKGFPFTSDLAGSPGKGHQAEVITSTQCQETVPKHL